VAAIDTVALSVEGALRWELQAWPLRVARALLLCLGCLSRLLLHGCLESLA
jgi:hypothetical protein